MKHNSIQEDIPWSEAEKIRHEINALYSKYEGLRTIVHRSVGLDNIYYIYFLENYGFDDYRIIARIPNID